LKNLTIDFDTLQKAHNKATIEWKELGFPSIFWNWLDETYGVEVYYDFKNRKIESYTVTNERKFFLFMIKHSS
jgi:hypothetical protein